MRQIGQVGNAGDRSTLSVGPTSGMQTLLALAELIRERLFGGYRAAATNGAVHLFMQILVRDNNVDQALRALKKKLQREGVYREMKLRRHYEKPSEKRARERAAAIRRARKMDRKRTEREGVK